jgi:hypothetical protein
MVVLVNAPMYRVLQKGLSEFVVRKRWLLPKAQIWRNYVFASADRAFDNSNFNVFKFCLLSEFLKFNQSRYAESKFLYLRVLNALNPSFGTLQNRLINDPLKSKTPWILVDCDLLLHILIS